MLHDFLGISVKGSVILSDRPEISLVCQTMYQINFLVSPTLLSGKRDLVDLEEFHKKVVHI